MKTTAIDKAEFESTLDNLKEGLFGFYNDERGHFESRLSSSALATATAVFALHMADPVANRELIESGLAWLGANVNSDGGWGDTVRNRSNISTTMLCWAAFSAATTNKSYAHVLKGARRWLVRRVGSLNAGKLAQALDAKYADDKTFSVPILTMCALAGIGGEGQLWQYIKPLAFELSVLPRGLLSRFRLSVVSYALPALIAMGIVHYRRGCAANFASGRLRRLCLGRSMKVLEQIQPDNGGFLEAVPLTSFVVMSLIGASMPDGPVVDRGLDFIRKSVCPDGSWRIDSNLSLWVSSLSVDAMAGASDRQRWFGEDESRIVEWLLAAQHRSRCEYTGALPGGWGWTNLPGSVPDADDTAGALVALSMTAEPGPRVIEAVRAGLGWLIGLQNSDGGIPTFCRGWTDMPFDRSGADLTAHAIKAMTIWQGSFTGSFRRRIDRALARAMGYLKKCQGPEGSWLPLWFGNEAHPDKHNPLYGTARVVTGICRAPGSGPMVGAGSRWILANQNDDGSWGGCKGLPGTIEETSQAVAALSRALACGSGLDLDGQALSRSLTAGIGWLMERTAGGRNVEAAPIGLYFAQLWYYEEVYPYIFAVSAFESARSVIMPA